MLYPCMLCVALLMCLFVLCVVAILLFALLMLFLCVILPTMSAIAMPLALWYVVLV